MFILRKRIINMRKYYKKTFYQTTFRRFKWTLIISIIIYNLLSENKKVFQMNNNNTNKESKFLCFQNPSMIKLIKHNKSKIIIIVIIVMIESYKKVKKIVKFLFSV